MCEHHPFVKSYVNICSLYIFCVIISVNYLLTESKFIRTNATEAYNDTSAENYEILNNNSEQKSIRPIKEIKRNSFEIRTTPTPDSSRITITAAVTNKDTTVTVWCFCNIASCVPNGYMCKSTIGACYSKSIEGVAQTQQSAHLSNTYYDSAANYLTRGCVEFLPPSERRRCIMKLDPWGDTERKLSLLNASEILIRSKYREEDTNANIEEDNNDLQCCNQDVCNYEVSQPVFVVRKSDDSHSSTMNSSFEWFRSATIAVSVAGLIILFMLIVFAGRMIIADTKSYAYRHQQVTDDIRSRSPFFGEQTLATSARGSILCAKSLQKNDRTSFCGLQPMKPSNRGSSLSSNGMHSFAGPISALSSCSTIDTSSHISSTTRACDFDFATPEEIEPLNNNRDSNLFLLDPPFPT